jgi:hypothetical protein
VSSELLAPASLADVARRYPDWECSQDTDRLFYAQLRDSDPPVTVRGEDLVDLCDQIQAWVYRQENAGLTPDEATQRVTRAAFVMREVGVMAAELARTAHAYARASDRRDTDAMCATAEALLELQATVGAKYRKYLTTYVGSTRQRRIPAPEAT